MKKLKLNSKPHNFVAKDLRTTKYRMRVVQSDKNYNRHALKAELKKEISYA